MLRDPQEVSGVRELRGGANELDSSERHAPVNKEPGRLLLLSSGGGGRRRATTTADAPPHIAASALAAAVAGGWRPLYPERDRGFEGERL